MKISFREMYRLALIEGEGLGTAYEYYVKLRLIIKNLKVRPKTALIYGLPEKYGYSLDFFWLAKQLGCKVGLKGPIKSGLKEKLKRAGLPEPDKLQKHDVLLTSEVVQSLDFGQLQQFKELADKAKVTFIFAPNKLNKSHSRLSGLRGFSASEMKRIFGGDCAYLDMPPFPPGIKKQKKFSNNPLVSLLVPYAKLEPLLPFRERFSHITYSIPTKKK